MPSVQRRRPTTRKGRPTLTRDLIAATALDLAGAEGFPAVTMRRLAAELGVTVRALYNYVEDRQEVVDLAAELLMSQWQLPNLDHRHWQSSVRAYADELRALYRRYPKALLISLDDHPRPSAVHPNRLRNPEEFLGLLHSVGLTPEAALLVHHELSLKLFGFSLLVDYRTDRPSIDDDLLKPVPDTWISAHAELDLPRLHEAIQSTAPTPDELFAQLIDTTVSSIRSHQRRARRG